MGFWLRDTLNMPERLINLMMFTWINVTIQISNGAQTLNSDVWQGRHGVCSIGEDIASSLGFLYCYQSSKRLRVLPSHLEAFENDIENSRILRIYIIILTGTKNNQKLSPCWTKVPYFPKIYKNEGKLNDLRHMCSISWESFNRIA